MCVCLTLQTWFMASHGCLHGAIKGAACLLIWAYKTQQSISPFFLSLALFYFGQKKHHRGWFEPLAAEPPRTNDITTALHPFCLPFHRPNTTHDHSSLLPPSLLSSGVRREDKVATRWPEQPLAALLPSLHPFDDPIVIDNYQGCCGAPTPSSLIQNNPILLYFYGVFRVQALALS